MLRPLTIACLAPLGAQAEAPRVVADIAPVHSLVARVMEGVGEPALIVPPGASPHDHALRPSEAAALAQADAVIWMGGDLAPWLDRSVGRLAPEALRIALPEVEGTVRLPARDDPLLRVDHGHDHGDVDPHGWLDPVNAATWLEAVAEGLAGLDPANAAAYRANAEAGRDELAALEAEVDDALAPFRGTRYAVLHDAFQYFEARFDVPASAAVAFGDAADPGPSRLRAVRDALRSEGVACAFAEPQLDPGLLEVATDGATTGVLDPLGAAHEPGPDLYPALIRDLARSLLGCLDA